MQKALPETILVTGSGGQLGSELKQLSLQYPEYRFIFTTRNELPVDNRKSILEYFNATRIDYCINCAAYTAVDKAESEPDFAFLINSEAVRDMAIVCEEHGTKLIHISTDYVYDGAMRTPLKESDPAGPLNVYGRSKLAGERFAQQHNPACLIIRTSWLYSSYGSNFLKTMMRLLVERKDLNVVSDQIGCPTYAADLAATILLFISQISAGKHFSGIYNYSNHGITTWYQFAQFIKDGIGSNCSLNPVTSEQYPAAARRPLYSVLDTTKIQKDLQPPMPFWKDSAAACIQKLLKTP